MKKIMFILIMYFLRVRPTHCTKVLWFGIGDCGIIQPSSRNTVKVERITDKNIPVKCVDLTPCRGVLIDCNS